MKKIIVVVVIIFALLNATFIYLIYNPATLIPLLSTTAKNQVYSYLSKSYPLGSYYTYTNNSRFVFVGKLKNVYTKDNGVYAQIQPTDNANTTLIANILFANSRLRMVDHPTDQLLGVYEQSHSQLLDNAQQVLYSTLKYKNQNLVFFAALPAGMALPQVNDPKIQALMEKPEIIRLIANQKKGAACNNELLKDFQNKKITSLNCILYISEIHVDTEK